MSSMAVVHPLALIALTVERHAVERSLVRRYSTRNVAPTMPIPALRQTPGTRRRRTAPRPCQVCATIVRRGVMRTVAHTRRALNAAHAASNDTTSPTESSPETVTAAEPRNSPREARPWGST